MDQSETFLRMDIHTCDELENTNFSRTKINILKTKNWIVAGGERKKIFKTLPPYFIQIIQ